MCAVTGHLLGSGGFVSMLPLYDVVVRRMMRETERDARRRGMVRRLASARLWTRVARYAAARAARQQDTAPPPEPQV
ncbi:hypothetical protein [Pseudonocardia spinosispora]|uniref:hypothetical protein n=1 Tax=Pseudonocardia spinosispora TaxID=103441 RepID=UPI00040DE59C|nr:hypothetical protein [Pseudonocardia spinosispora]